MALARPWPTATNRDLTRVAIGPCPYHRWPARLRCRLADGRPGRPSLPISRRRCWPRPPWPCPPTRCGTRHKWGTSSGQPGTVSQTTRVEPRPMRTSPSLTVPATSCSHSPSTEPAPRTTLVPPETATSGRPDPPSRTRPEAAGLTLPTASPNTATLGSWRRRQARRLAGAGSQPRAVEKRAGGKGGRQIGHATTTETRHSPPPGPANTPPPRVCARAAQPESWAISSARRRVRAPRLRPLPSP